MGDPERLEGVDVGLIWQLGREETVPAAMSGEKDHLAPVEPPDHELIAGTAKRGVDGDLFDDFQLWQVVEAAAADDTQLCARLCLSHVTSLAVRGMVAGGSSGRQLFK